MFKEATIFFSSDKISTIANVIPSMDRIDTLLKDKSPRALHGSVKHGIVLARKTLNRYYSKTDISNVYRIAMGECLP